MSKSQMKSNDCETAGRDQKIVALSPVGFPPRIQQLGMAPRLDTLDGKTVYLVDTRFDDGDILLRQMEAWFAEHMPTVKTVYVSKSGVYTQDDPELFQEIKEKGDAMVMTVGH